MNNDGPPFGQAYPLSLLFVLVACVAVVAAMVAPAVHDPTEYSLAALFIFVSVVVGGATLGAVFGLHHVRRWPGVLTGSLAGLLVGIPSGLLVLLSPKSFGRTILVSLSGAALLILLTVVMKRLSRSD